MDSINRSDASESGWGNNEKVRRFLWSIFICGCILAMLLFLIAQARTDARLRVSFLDVGQGDAILIQAPNGRQVLIDGGPDGSVLRMLGSVMPLFDRSIDMVILTHPDLDHVGGLPLLLSRYSVGVVFAPDVDASSTAFTALKERIRNDTSVALMHPVAGTTILLTPDIVLRILFPDRSMLGSAVNTASIVVHLTYGSHTMLFMGDAPASVENYLLSRYQGMLASTVLKVGHHGSNTSSSETFLHVVAPKYAVISSGRDNRYGHPHKVVLERLEKSGATVLRTDKDGVIHILSDGKRLAVVK